MKKRLRLMKKEALLINVGRGSLIKNDALLHVLKEGHLKGVALDVSEIEPLPKASPLWDLPNVFITPHIAGPSFGGNTDVEQAIWNLCFENIERFSCRSGAEPYRRFKARLLIVISQYLP